MRSVTSPRPRVVALVLGLAIALAVSPGAKAATLSRLRPAAPPSTWHPGKALAVAGSRLLSVWASDCPPPSGACATDRGPSMGVFIQRAASRDDPPRWSTPRRLSPPHTNAERATIGADGRMAAAGWVTQASYLRYRPRAPRVFWLRTSRDRGRTWSDARRLTPLAGRVDHPRVAVSGARVFAVWTDADTGRIRLAMSDDRGRSWRVRTIGSTTARANGRPEGFAGLPDIAVSGSIVAVVWFADRDGAQVAVASSIGGDDLGPSSTPLVLTSAAPIGGAPFPGAGGGADGRVALAVVTQTGLSLAEADADGLAPAAEVFSWPVTVGKVRYDGGYGPAVLTAGTDGVVLAFAACRRNAALSVPCDPLAKGARIDILYAERPEGSLDWSSPRRITDASVAPYKVNDEPALAIAGGRRLLTFDRYQSSFLDYRVWMRSVTP
jgi:hypothetical protein